MSLESVLHIIRRALTYIGSTKPTKTALYSTWLLDVLKAQFINFSMTI